LIKKRVIISIFTILAFFALMFGLATSGNMFLSFLGEKLHINLVYKTNAGFVSCFILRSIKLENPKLHLEDIDVNIACKTAYFRPRFDEIVDKKTIVLDCVLNDVFFPDVTGDLQSAKELPFLLQGSTQALTDMVRSVAYYDYVYATLALHDDRVTFRSFEAKSDSLRLNASGFITEGGDFEIKLKIFFSPEFTKDFPEEAKGFLTQEGSGWLSYSFKAENSQNSMFFNLESDQIKINFKKVEVH